MSQAQDDSQQLLAEAFVGFADTLVDDYDIIDVLDAAARWPHFAAALHERTAPDHHRYRSLHALPLRRRGEAIGALNLFHTHPGPHPEADLRLGQALADSTPRVIIEQAKGVLAQLGNLPMDVAFERLRRHARRHNTLLGDVARRAVTDRGFARQLLGVGVR